MHRHEQHRRDEHSRCEHDHAAGRAEISGCLKRERRQPWRACAKPTRIRGRVVSVRETRRSISLRHQARRYLGRHAMTPATILVLALIVAPAVVLAALRWRRALLEALPFLAIVNGVPLRVGGVAIRVDQLAALALLIPLAASVVSGRRQLRLDVTTRWLAVLLALNVLASLVHSPARSYSLQQCANLASAWSIYVVLVNFVETREELGRLFDRALWAALAASGIGVAAFVLGVSGFPLGGAEVSTIAVEHLTQAYGAYGTMFEPNIFGSFTGAYLVLALGVLAFTGPASVEASRLRLVRWTAVGCAAGLVLSFTRSAWLGAMGSVVVLATLGGRTRAVRTSRVIVPVVVLLGLVLVLLLLPGNAGTLLRFKLANLLNLGSQTMTLRVLTYTLALQQTLEHPIIGSGTFTFAPLVAQGGDFAQFENWRNLWIGNYLLLALHDTGVLGLVAWVGMLWSVLRRGVRATASADPELGSSALTLTAAVASLLIPFLATTGFSLGYPWLLIGLLGVTVRLAEVESVRPIAAPAPAAHEDPVPAAF